MAATRNACATSTLSHRGMQGCAIVLRYNAKHVFRNNRCVWNVTRPFGMSSVEGFVEGSQSSKTTRREQLSFNVYSPSTLILFNELKKYGVSGRSPLTFGDRRELLERFEVQQQDTG